MSGSGSAPAQLVEIGRVVGVFGIIGELRVATPDAGILTPGTRIVVRTNDAHQQAFTIAKSRAHQRGWVVKFRELNDAGSAGALRGSVLMLARDRLPALPEDTYRDADLVGMQVQDETLGQLGVVQTVRHYPHCDMLVVGTQQLLVPLLRAYQVRVELETRRIFTCLPAGYEELR